MKNHYYRYAVLIGVLLLFSNLSAQGQSRWQAPMLLEGATKVSAEELVDLIAEFDNIAIIDSRPLRAENEFTIDGAVALPGRSMSPLQLAQVVADKFTPVVFFCDGIHSSHSYRAAKKVVALGYANVFWFRGGIQEWADKGLPIVALHK